MEPMKPMKPMAGMKPMEPMRPMKWPDPWWPASYGEANSAGGQNDVRYAYFAEKRRLIVERAGKRHEYDTGDHRIEGIRQAQADDFAHIAFTSQSGSVTLESLREIR